MAIDNELLLEEVNRTAMLMRRAQRINHMKHHEEYLAAHPEKKRGPKEGHGPEGGRGFGGHGAHGFGSGFGGPAAGGPAGPGPRGPEGDPRMQQRQAQHRVLALLTVKEGLSQKDLAYLLGIRPQSLSETLAKLESHELIERRRNESDGRVFNVYLTDKGREKAEKVAEHSQKRAAALFEPLTEDEKQQLYDILGKLTDAWEEQAREAHRQHREKERAAAASAE